MFFVDSPRVFGILGYLYSKEVVREASEEGTIHLGAPGPPSAPWWVGLPSELPYVAFLAHYMSSGPKNSTKSFTAFGLRLVLISCDVKNM